MTAELVNIIRIINQHMKAKQFTKLNELLYYADLKTMEAVTMVAYMRTPYVVRSQLPAWRSFVGRCDNELALRGYDDARRAEIFKGLEVPVSAFQVTTADDNSMVSINANFSITEEQIEQALAADENGE